MQQPAQQQHKFPPEKATNLEVLPKKIPIPALIDTMRAFTRALGVRCSYCHVGEEGAPLERYDFASDRKVEKQKARAMLRMVSAINGSYLTKVPERRDPPIVVGCATCHRGVAQPRPIQELVTRAYEAGGADSAEATYRSLRQRYYGRAAYDFGDVPLTDVGALLRARGATADAIRFYLLNTELSPTSPFAFRQAAAAQLAAGDTTAAIASLRRALELNPNDGQAKQLLQGLDKH